MDGLGAWSWTDTTVRLFVNHELEPNAGYRWKLSNGTTMTGARISWFDIDKRTMDILGAGNAITEVRDRRGNIVTNAEQISEVRDRGLLDLLRGKGDEGLNNLCSAQAYKPGEFGFVDDILFTHEEVATHEGHPHGGSVWALEVRSGTLWALPELGRGVSVSRRPDGSWFMGRQGSDPAALAS